MYIFKYVYIGLCVFIYVYICVTSLVKNLSMHIYLSRSGMYFLYMSRAYVHLSDYIIARLL